MKNKKKKMSLKCYCCDNKPTHAVMIELRDRPGPPLKENNVIRLACDIHSVETAFEHWVPHYAFIALCNHWKKETGVILDKRFCNIHIVKFQ